MISRIHLPSVQLKRVTNAATLLGMAIAAFSLAACGSSNNSGLVNENPGDYFARATIAVVNANAEAQGYAQQGRAIAQQQTDTAQKFVVQTQEANRIIAAQTAAAAATATEAARPTETPLPTDTPLPTATPLPPTATSTPLPATATPVPVMSATPNGLQLTATVAAFNRRASRDSFVDDIGRNALLYGTGAAVLIVAGYYGFKLLWNFIQALRLKNAKPPINIVADEKNRPDNTQEDWP